MLFREVSGLCVFFLFLFDNVDIKNGLNKMKLEWFYFKLFKLCLFLFEE